MAYRRDFHGWRRWFTILCITSAGLEGPSGSSATEILSELWTSEEQVSLQMYMNKLLERTIELSQPEQVVVYVDPRCPIDQRVLGELPLTAILPGPVVVNGTQGLPWDSQRVNVLLFCPRNVTKRKFDRDMYIFVEGWARKYQTFLPVYFVDADGWSIIDVHGASFQEGIRVTIASSSINLTYYQATLFGVVRTDSEDGTSIEGFVFGKEKRILEEASWGLRLLHNVDSTLGRGSVDNFERILKRELVVPIRRTNFRVDISQSNPEFIFDFVSVNESQIERYQYSVYLFMDSSTLSRENMGMNSIPMAAVARVPSRSVVSELLHSLLEPAMLVPSLLLAILTSIVMGVGDAIHSTEPWAVHKACCDGLKTTFYLLSSIVSCVKPPEHIRHRGMYRWLMAVGLWLLSGPVLTCFIRSDLTSSLQGLPSQRQLVFDDCEAQFNVSRIGDRFEGNERPAYHFWMAGSIQAFLAGYPVCYDQNNLELIFKAYFPHIYVYRLDNLGKEELRTTIFRIWSGGFTECERKQLAYVRRQSLWRVGNWVSRIGLEQKGLLVDQKALIQKKLGGYFYPRLALEGLNESDFEEHRGDLFSFTIDQIGLILLVVVVANVASILIFSSELALNTWERRNLKVLIDSSIRIVSTHSQVVGTAPVSI